MKQRFDLDPSAPNYAWCFDCVPEENSLLLRFGNVRIEIPSQDLVLTCPRPLLGEKFTRALARNSRSVLTSSTLLAARI